MADPVVDDSLLDTRCGTIAAKRVSQRVPAVQNFPLATFECSREVIVELVRRQWTANFAILARPANVLGHRKGHFATRMDSEPIAERGFQQWCHWHAPCGLHAPNAFQFSNGDHPSIKIEIGNLAASDFAPSGSRVSCKRERRVNELVTSVEPNMLK